LKHWILMPAAGAGRRCGGAIPKQYQMLAGRPVILHTLERLLGGGAAGLVVVLAPADIHWPALAPPADPRLLVATGGAERIDSVRAGLERLAGLAAADDLVLVHDAVRPCVTAEDVAALLAAADHPGGAVLGVPVVDTLKRVGADGAVAATEPRTGLWAAQTPQLFRFALLREALAQAARAGGPITDEAAAVEAAGHRPRMVPGRRDNIKITWPGDLELAAAILARQAAETA
jgi:2-C-methyl-D-erythritol 4-phosphate cytidylyltransferase